MVIYGDRKRLLGFFLTDHVLGKLFVELFGRGQIGEHVGMLRRAFLDARHKLVAEHLIERFGFKPAHGKIGEHRIDRYRNALIADEDAIRSRDHGVYLLGNLPAEGAIDSVVRSRRSFISHETP